MVAALRGNGVVVTDDPVVLTRQSLGGVVPGADVVGAGFCLALGALFAVASLGVSLVWLHQRRKLLRQD